MLLIPVPMPRFSILGLVNVSVLWMLLMPVPIPRFSILTPVNVNVLWMLLIPVPMPRFSILTPVNVSAPGGVAATDCKSLMRKVVSVNV